MRGMAFSSMVIDDLDLLRPSSFQTKQMRKRSLIRMLS
jgi:hypothetical protein